MDTEFQFGKMKKVLVVGRVRRGENCTKIPMYLIPLNFISKNGHDVKFCVIYILRQLSEVQNILSGFIFLS